MAWDFEVTDTFGGEANYSWVQRTRVEEALTDKQVVRRLKAFAGWTGHPCVTNERSRKFGPRHDHRAKKVAQMLSAKKESKCLKLYLPLQTSQSFWLSQDCF